jgi:PhnB protein
MGMHSAALGRPNNSEWVSSLSRKADTMTRLNKSYVCLLIFLRFCPLDFSEYSFLMHFLFSVLLVRNSPNMAVSEQGRLHCDEELQSPPDIARRSRSLMRMNTYVNFGGNCAEAFRYYERHLGAKVGMMMTHAQSPDQSRVGLEWKDAVLHARIVIGDDELMAADIPNAEPMRSAYLTLRMDSDIEAERVFSALSDGGRVLMPMEET